MRIFAALVAACAGLRRPVGLMLCLCTAALLLQPRSTRAQEQPLPAASPVVISAPQDLPTTPPDVPAAPQDAPPVAQDAPAAPPTVPPAPPASPAPPPAPKEEPPTRHRVEDTAYTLSGGEFSIGLYDLQFGIIDEVTIGTYIGPWFAFPFVQAPIPSAFVKVRDWFHGPVALSLRATGIYISATALAEGLGRGDEVSAAAIILPLEAAVSLEAGSRLNQSFSLTWLITQADGSRSSSTSVAGAVSGSQLSLSSLSEYKIADWFFLTLQARILLAQSNVRARVQAEQGRTSIDADIGLDADYGHLVACVIPGIALRGRHLNFELGVGYGSWWLPIVGLALPTTGPVPVLNFYVRF
jgi:hypothetical protein